MADATLCPQVTDVLRRSTITENLLVLPEGHIDFYPKVKKALEAAGGKWNRSKQGFVFTSDPRAKLGLALETGVVVDEKKARQAFYTPARLAAEVVELADVNGRSVLEPSAGDGVLVFEAIAQGAKVVHAVEIDPDVSGRLRAELVRIVGESKASVATADFLGCRASSLGQYDRIVMNPPFSKGQALKHVTHAKAFIAPGGKLFAIVPDKDCPKFAALGAVTVKRFPSGAFKESGTSVATRLVRIERPDYLGRENEPPVKSRTRGPKH